MLARVGQNDPMVVIGEGVVPDDVERCIDLWVEAVRARDGVVDPAPVSERARRVFAGPLVRFAVATKSTNVSSASGEARAPAAIDRAPLFDFTAPDVRNPPSLIGFAVTVASTDAERTARLERIAVHPTATGRGAGRLLLDDAIASARDAGCVAIELAVRTGNRAVRMYAAAGFRPVSDPVPHPLGGEPMVTYSLDL